MKYEQRPFRVASPRVSLAFRAALALLAAVPWRAAAQTTITLQRGDGKGSPSETDDAELLAGSPSTNSSTGASLNVDGSPHIHVVLKFPNIFGWGANQIPPGSTILSATLTLNVTGTTVVNPTVYQLTESWVESQVTWNSRSTGVSWTNAGADGTGSHKGTADGNFPSGATGFQSLSVTTSVQNWSNGEPNEGWVFTDNSTDGADYASSENGTLANRPQLSVTYLPCGAASLPFSDDFNRANSSTVGNCWTETESAGNDATINANRLVLVTNNVDGVPLVQRTFTPVSSGYLRWTFALDWARVGAENFYSVFMQLGNSGTFGTPPADGASEPGAAINLRWGDDNLGFTTEEGFGYVRGTTQTQVATLTGLHTVEVIANLNAQTYTIKVDGATVATGVAFDKSLAAIGGSINAVRIYQGEGISSGTGGNQAFDDVSIQTITYAVNVTPNGLASPVVRQPGTGYQQDFSVTNNSTLTEDFDLLAWTTPGASFITVDSITGSGVTQGAQADSARLSGLGSGASRTVSVWYTVAASTDGRVDTLFLRARSVFDPSVRDDGWAQVEFDSPCGAASLPFSDDFNRANSSTVGNCWTETESAGNDATINANRLVFVTNDVDLVPRVQRNFTPVSSGFLRWTFVMDWARGGAENFYSVFMQLGNSGAFGTPPADGASVPGAAINLRWGDDNFGFPNEEGFGYVRGTTQTQVTTVTGLHTVEVIANLNAQSYTIKVDGATVATGIAFDKSLASIGGSINAVRIYQGEGIGAGAGGNKAFDDVSIETVTFAVAVTTDGVDTLSRLPSNATGYSYAYSVTNNSSISEDFDLLGEPGDTAATVFTVDSITGTNVTRAPAVPDSARLSGLGVGASATVTVWYRVSNAAAGTLDSLYLRARSVINVNASDRGWFFVRLVKPNLSTGKSVSPSGTQVPGTELTYTVTFTNAGSADASVVAIVDSLAAEVQFKVGSIVNNLPSGVTAVVEYSNDGGASWTYTPVSGGCGAPVNFDGCVSRVRWTFQNPLSSGAPNNTGDVRLVARIK